MQLIFIPDPEVHSKEIAFPIRFIVSVEKSTNDPDLNFAGIPAVMVYANRSYETQLPVGVDFEVQGPIERCLQVKFREAKPSVVSLAIKEALTSFSSYFGGYDIVAEFTLTPQS